MKMIKKISIAALSLASLNASAAITYNKHELVKNINQIIKKVQHLKDYEAPESCKWHVKQTSEYVYKARKNVFDGSELSLTNHLFLADKALEDLKYEGEDCEQIKVKSQNLSNLIQNVIEKIEHQKS